MTEYNSLTLISPYVRIIQNMSFKIRQWKKSKKSNNCIFFIFADLTKEECNELKMTFSDLAITLKEYFIRLGYSCKYDSCTNIPGLEHLAIKID